MASANDLWATDLWAEGLWATDLWANIPTPAVVPAEPDQPTGGFAGRNMYDAEEELRREKRERLRAIQAEIRRLNRWR